MSHDEMRAYRREIIASYFHTFYEIFGEYDTSFKSISAQVRRVEVNLYGHELRLYK